MGLKRREARNPHSAVLCESKTDVDLEVLCAAPPEALPHSPSRADPRRGTHRHDAGLWTCRPPRLRPRRHAEHFAGLQVVRLRALARRRAPKRTPHVAGLQTSPRCRRQLRTSPGCRLRRASRPRTRRLAPKKNFATRPPTRAEEYLAVTTGCRPRTPDAKARGRCLENPPCNVKKPFAWVSKGALGTKLARPGAKGCIP